MDERRLAAVFAVDGKRQTKTSTGYVVAPRLLLTAAHAVEPAGRIEVQLLDQADPMPCAIIWNGREYDLDAALLEVDRPHWPSNVPEEPVRFGRLATLMPRTPAETIGFPAAQRDPDGDLETAHVYGHINPGDRLLSGRWVLSIAGTSPEDLGSSPWSGISGAPVFSGELLCGVVVVDPPHWRHGKLDAIQAHHVLRNEEFRTLLRERLGYSPVAEAVELESLAEPVTLSRPPRSLPELLRPQAETVRFFGREDQVAEFRAWCQGDGVMARLLAGPGGQGKTRFARELARALAAEGWIVAQVRDSAPAESYKILGKVGPRLLLIMDYADTRPGSVAEVMRVFEEEGNKGTVRILLIARSAGEWWDQLPASASAYVSLLSGAAVVQLAEVADNLPTRQNLYRTALLDLARGLRRLPDYADVDWESVARALPPADLSDARLSSALTLQVRALTDLLTAHPEALPSQPGSTVEALFLAHEERYWTKTACRRLLLRELTADELGNAVAAATLTRVSGKERAVELLALVPRLSSTPERVRSALAAWLSDLYPASTESYWSALEPDRLGEYHVSERIRKEPTFLQEFLPALDTDEAERALIVLARAGAQPIQPCLYLLDQVATLITVHPERLAVPAALVATRSENPGFLIEALTGVANRPDLSVDLLEALNMAFPTQTASLAEPALNVANWLVRANRRAVRRAWLLPAPPSTLISVRTAARADLARAYHNYSHRLMSMGQWDKAVISGSHAIRLYRRLTRRRPDIYRLFLAGSLNNQAIALSSTNRLGEALKAARQARAMHRILAADGSDVHRVGLARSLSNVAEIFARLDANQAALNASAEAVAILSQLADRKPGPYLPELASALHNHASNHARGGSFDEAKAVSARTVAIRRRLAVQRPDANLPGLAHSLHNLSIDLIAEGQREPASKIIDESISFYLRLVLDKGNGYLPYLANALNTKSAQCCASDRRREGAIASARSVLIYIRLAREGPAEFQADLTMALRNHRWARFYAGLFQPAKWDAVLKEADELIQRYPAKALKPVKRRALREDEEIRNVAREMVSVSKENIRESWLQIKETLDRYRITAPPDKQPDSGPSAGKSAWLPRGTPIGVIKRISLIFRSKVRRALSQAEDPSEILDPSYQRQLNVLKQVRQGVSDVDTSGKRVELQMDQLRHQQAALERMAKQALGAGREDLAREALSRKAPLQDQLDDLDSLYGRVRADKQKLTMASERLYWTIDTFRMQKEIITATYIAAQAQSRIGTAISGLSAEMGSVGMAMQRAQDKTTHMQARAGALDKLMASSAPDDVTGPLPEEIQAELDRMGSGMNIDAELDRLKSEISGSPDRGL